jgi:hypothetical protein
MTATDYFWTSIEQAIERLRGTVVIYDGKPVYVSAIEPNDGGSSTPKALIHDCDDPDQKISRKILSSAKFEKFRVLPNLGWVNLHGRRDAVFVYRRTTASRLHGLAGVNTYVEAFDRRNGLSLSLQIVSFDTVYTDKGFTESHQNNFPNLNEILVSIREDTAIAYSRIFCVSRDNVGIRWLYKNKDRVGLFVGNDTLNIFTKFAFLREEIMADPSFTVNNIREF